MHHALFHIQGMVYCYDAALACNNLLGFCCSMGENGVTFLWWCCGMIGHGHDIVHETVEMDFMHTPCHTHRMAWFAFWFQLQLEATICVCTI